MISSSECLILSKDDAKYINEVLRQLCNVNKDETFILYKRLSQIQTEYGHGLTLYNQLDKFICKCNSLENLIDHESRLLEL